MLVGKDGRERCVLIGRRHVEDTEILGARVSGHPVRHPAARSAHRTHQTMTTQRGEWFGGGLAADDGGRVRG